jgi:hypothetical protein
MGIGLVVVQATIAAAQPYNLSYGRDYRQTMASHAYGSSSYYGWPNYYRTTDYRASLPSLDPFVGWQPLDSAGPQPRRHFGN